ncbi:amino acid adenylation domain-containing protein, partial [Alcaligenes faecalis]|uniref:non-ribosomal peptide synthetase n=1 Tax=Alcaligenes faecalis TaxID=511 RepID=UPI0029324D6C
SAQSRPVFGTVLFGRMQGGQGIDQAMGMFINTLPVCIDLEHQSVAQALQQTHQRLTALLSHEHASLSLAQQCSGVPAGVPLFTSVLNYRYSDLDNLDEPVLWDGMQVLAGQERTNYPVGLSVDDDGRVFRLVVQVVSEISAERIATYMQSALQELVDGLQKSRSVQAMDVSVLPLSETAQFACWASNPDRYSTRVPIHQLIEEQAQRTPDAIALSFEQQNLSYVQLNEQANRLAHALLQQGCGLEERIGVALDRSLDMVVSLLAVLKAGAAYVPLDPQYPLDRLSYIAHSSGMQRVISTRALQRTMCLQNVEVIAVDELDLSGFSGQDPAVSLHAGNLAYVIYTSGSTGLPKGVAVSHGPLAMHIQAIADVFDMRADDRALHTFSFSFDAAGDMWIVPLIRGARVYITPDILLQTDDLKRRIRDDSLSVINLPPAYVRQLCNDLEPKELSVRVCIVGGEAFGRDDYRQIVNKLDAQRVVNAYGPTETIIATSMCVWQRGEQESQRALYMPIGKPVGSRVVHILDVQLRHVPLGVAGELYVGGIGLARAYLGRADLTADRFVADPFSEQGARLYRTGDIVKWNEQGQLEYLARIDDQIKVRGFRIELGEVESRVQALPGVQEAVVVAKQAASDTRLLAYVVPEGGNLLTPSVLRAALAAELPDYMVPSVIMVLEALPLNANGKIDRKALPEPEFVSGQTYEAPQGELDTTLATIWSQVLGVEQVGRQDNFFELGGHSLLALTLIERLRAAGIVSQ